jgi:hypothetical protein
MASIGTLCAGLGHDMGNLLLPLSIWINTVRSRDLPPDFEEGVENLSACIQYLRRLASGLRLVSLDPSQSTRDDAVNLSKWLEEVEPILRNTLPRNVTLKSEMPTGLPAVGMAPHRLAQVAFNLIQNSGEVLRDRSGGVVRLWAQRDPESNGVRIGVSDNGPGMSAETLKRCLDPYFTTKKRGITTGLGLSLVHGIVQAAGAHLDIESTRGQGTTFSFVLAPIERTLAPDVLAIVSVADPRMRGLVGALVGTAGCKCVNELPKRYGGIAVRITDSIEDVECHADEFLAGGEYRGVFLIGGDQIEKKNVCICSLTGSRGLALELRRFLATITEINGQAMLECQTLPQV